MIWLVEVRDNKIWSPVGFDWYLTFEDAQDDIDRMSHNNANAKFRARAYVRQPNNPVTGIL
jgi:hypothetical protein